MKILLAFLMAAFVLSNVRFTDWLLRHRLILLAACAMVAASFYSLAILS